MKRFLLNENIKQTRSFQFLKCSDSSGIDSNWLSSFGDSANLAVECLQ